MEINFDYTPECRERIRISYGITKQESTEILDQLIAEAVIKDAGFQRPTFVKLSCGAQA